MNVKDQINFISLQENLIAILIKVSVIESLLVDKNMITAEEYNKKLEAAAAVVSNALKPVVEKLNQIKESQEKSDVDVKVTSIDEALTKEPIDNKN